MLDRLDYIQIASTHTHRTLSIWRKRLRAFIKLRLTLTNFPSRSRFSVSLAIPHAYDNASYSGRQAIEMILMRQRRPFSWGDPRWISRSLIDVEDGSGLYSYH